MKERHKEIVSALPHLNTLPQLRGFRLRGTEMTRLETFIDAAFAFAITMLVIAAQQIPDDIDSLLGAFKNVPTFVTSIGVLGIFWSGHWLWSRRYGLEIEKIHGDYEAELKRLTAEQAQMREVYEAELKRQKAGMLCAVRTLSRLLEDVEKAANRLRSSRRWGLANPVTAIRAKLFPGSVTIGYGYLEKIVAAYAKWKDSHPEIAKIDEQINALRRAVATVEAERGLEPSAQKLEAPGLPVPAVHVESISFPTQQDHYGDLHQLGGIH